MGVGECTRRLKSFSKLPFFVFQDRKRFLPPCPKRKRKRIGKLTSAIKSTGTFFFISDNYYVILSFNINFWFIISCLLVETNASQSTSDESSTKPSICGCCMEAPCNGIFVHGDVGHQIFCYRCSHRLWLERKTCPYCNRSISKVVKLFQVG